MHSFPGSFDNGDRENNKDNNKDLLLAAVLLDQTVQQIARLEEETAVLADHRSDLAATGDGDRAEDSQERGKYASLRKSE